MATKITRSAKLLNYYENDNGNIKLYTDLDTDIAVNDLLYIVGGDLDNVSTMHMYASGDYNPYTNSSLGYKVLAVYPTVNGITIQKTHTSGLSIGTHTFISRTAFEHGELIYGKFYEGTFGKNESTITKMGPKVVPSVYRNILAIPTNWWSGIWLGGTFTSGRFCSWTNITTQPNPNTVKMDLIAGVPTLQVSSINNGGIGYSKWYSGIFGLFSASTSLITSKMFTGQFLGGEWRSGELAGGLVTSSKSRVTWTNGKFTGGNIGDIIWEDGQVAGGTLTMYGQTKILNVTANASTDPTAIRFHVTKERALLFLNTDYVSIWGVGPSIKITGGSSGITISGGGGSGLAPVSSIEYSPYHAYYTTSPTVVVNDSTLEYYIEVPLSISGTFTAPNIDNGYITFSQIKKVYATSGSLSGAVVGNTVDTELVHCEGATIGPCIWLGGAITSGSVIGSALIGPVKIMHAWINFISGLYMHMVDGTVNNGTFNQCSFEGGVFREGFYTNSIFTKGNGSKETFIGSGSFDYCTKMSDVAWDSVILISTNDWQGYSGSQPATISNTPTIESDAIPNSASGPTVKTSTGIVLGSKYGTYNVTAVAAKNALPSLTYLSLQAGDALRIDAVESLFGDLYVLFKVIDSNDVDAIDDANTADQNTLPSLDNIPFEGVYDASNTPVTLSTVKYTVYRQAGAPPAPTYPTSANVKLRLKSLNTGTDYDYDLNNPPIGGNLTIPTMETFELYLLVEMDTPPADTWRGDALQLNNLAVSMTMGPIPPGYPYTASQNIPGVVGDVFLAGSTSDQGPYIVLGPFATPASIDSGPVTNNIITIELGFDLYLDRTSGSTPVLNLYNFITA